MMRATVNGNARLGINSTRNSWRRTTMESVPRDDLQTDSLWTIYLLGGVNEPSRDPDLFTGTETYENIYEHLLEPYGETAPSTTPFDPPTIC